jgi:phosphate transport system substrate-binding protein
MLKTRKVASKVIAISSAMILAASVATPAQAATITGSGSTAIKNLLDICIPKYNAQSGHTISYAGGGSGAGRTAFNNGTVDFGMSDATYAATAAQPTGKFVYVPLTQFPLALIIKLDGVTNIQLSPATVAGIFAGQITKWNDAKIVADNTPVTTSKVKGKTVTKAGKAPKLPDTAITVWYRSDSSGSTGILTGWMQATAASVWAAPRTLNQTFATAFGGTVPAGTFQGASGSDGVANGVASKNGSIGYAETSYGTERKLLIAKVQNNNGEFVAPTAQATAKFINGFAAGANGAITIDYTAKVEGGYTIAGYTYGLAFNSTAGKSAVNQSIVQNFFSYVLNDCATSSAENAGYAPLTGKLKDLAEDQILKIK